MEILLALAFILGLTLVAAKLLDVFLSREQKRMISEKLEEIWLKLDDAGLQAVVQSPLRLLEAVYDFTFGANLFSKKGYTRATGLGVWLIIMLLSIDGIMASQPFGFKKYPWEMLGSKPPKSEQLIDQLKTIPNHQIDQATLERYQLSVDFTNWIISRDTMVAKSIYTVLIIASILFFGSFLFYVSLCISRSLLQEAIKSTNVVTIFGVLSLDILIVIILSSILYFILILLVYPSWIPFTVIVASLVVKSPSVLVFVIPLLIIIFTISIPAWLGDIIIITISPAVILFASAFMGLILFPISKPLYKIMNNIILRTLEHEKGVVYVFVFVLGSITTIIGLVAHFLSR